MNQSEIIACLKKHPAWSANQYSVGSERQLRIEREYIYLDRKAETKRSLDSLIAKGIVLDDYGRYCLSDSYLTSQGIDLQAELISTLSILHAEEHKKAIEHCEPVLSWRRARNYGSNFKIEHDPWNDDCICWLRYTYTSAFTGYNGCSARPAFYDNWHENDELDLQLIEQAIAKAEYQASVNARKAYFARLAGKE